MDREKTTYEALLRVYRGGYSGIVLDDILKNIADERDRAYISKLFYGVLEKDAAFSYALNKLCSKSPKQTVGIVIRMGMYMLKYMDVPRYAAIDKTVNLAKKLGKGGACGFVNAVLRRFADFQFPARGTVPDGVYLSVQSGAPVWLTDRLCEEYGFDTAMKILCAKPYEGTHIRRNKRLVSDEEFSEKLIKLNDYRPDSCKIGYYATHNTMKQLPQSYFTPQSLASSLAAEYYLAALGRGRGRILDVCSAPGGKAVYMSEAGEFDIVASDKYEHRIKLIEKYAARMGADIKTVRNDACVLRDEWKNAFDLVVCDVPCSGLGVLNSKPDIALNRSLSSMSELSALQYRILRVSSQYVAEGGTLCYSTCTLLREENEDVVGRFLKDGDFEIFTPVFPYGHVTDGALKLFPYDGTDGFFAVAFRRKKV